MTWNTKNLSEYLDYPSHLARQVYYRLKKIRLVILLLAIFAVAFYLSVFRNIDRLEFYRKYHAEVQFAKKLTNIFYLPLMLSAPRLERYDLVVEEKDLEFLNRNLPELYAGQMLTEQYKQSVKAKFVFNGKEYDVKTRYRGLMDNHWRDPQKSWLVTFKPKTGNFENQRQIHLIIASDRSYLMEELSYYRARKLGLIVPETKFIDLFVNGERQGVYWQHEDWDNSMLTRRNIEGNLYGSNDLKDFTEAEKNTYVSDGYWEDYSGTNDFSKLNLLLGIINNPSDEYFNQRIGELLDLESFYRWQIVHYLADSTHQTAGKNIKIYFDLTKGKFVLLPSDVGLGEAPPQLYEYNYNLLITRILKNPVFLQERNRRLWEYVSDDKNLEDDLRHYDYLDQLTRNDFYKDFKKTDSNFAYRDRVTDIREQIREKFLFLRKNLESSEVSIKTDIENNSAIINIGSKGFSSINISEIEALSDNCDTEMSLYIDANSNNQYDNSDQNLGRLSCANNVYVIRPDYLIYAVKDDSDGQYLKPDLNSKTFFIVSPDTSAVRLLTRDKINIRLQNSISGKEITAF